MPEMKQDEIARLQEEYDQDPEGRLFLHLAEAYRKSGELERARDLLQRGLEQHSDYVSAQIVLAEVQEALRADDQARTAWRRVLELDDENEVALRALALLEERTGRKDEARAYYRRLGELGAAEKVVQVSLAPPEAAEAEPAAALAEEPVAAARVEDEVAVAKEEKEEEPTATVEAVEPRAAREEARPAPRRATLPTARPQPPEPPVAQTDAIGLSDVLVRLLEYRDSTFHAESSLTRLLALAIGRELELEQSHLDALALAALLSDLGGIALTERRLSRVPASEESAERRRAAQREVAISLQLLHGITLPAGVHEAIRHQHERWDGTGHPDGLRDEEIPYVARVLAIARACAAMLVSREDGSARTVAEALDELQRQAGSHYDPVVINVLRRVFQHRAVHGIGYGLGGRVVIVHPEELRAISLATQLHSNGYVTEMTAETAGLRDRLRSGAVKALVVGANLPGNDVARFIRDVRARQTTTGGIPIVVLDANDVEERVALLTAGADVCIPSEVAFREFKAALDALLRRTEENGAPQDLGLRSVEASA